MLSKHYRGGGGLAVLLGVVGSIALSACGDSFTSCKESRTCRPPGGSPSDGGEPTLEAGAGGDTAASGGDTGSSDGLGGSATVGGAGGETLADEGGAPPVVTPDDTGEACSDNGTLRCVGPAQKVSQICEAGKWETAVICKADENCDQASGACAPIVADCKGKIGGQLYCGPDDKVFACGPDLVSTAETEECSGKCIDSDASASCAPVTCGDAKLQAPEECDDGNEDQTDACTNACKKATCGDGSLWKDDEACDDGNAKNDDACSATCKASTCGDGYVWAGKETCDDKNKVDTDACTNACKKASCGDGIVQAGKEECDDKNPTSGDGCSKTCTVEPVQIVGLAGQVCALGSNGQIRCFGAGQDDWTYTPMWPLDQAKRPPRYQRVGCTSARSSKMAGCVAGGTIVSAN
jgi:cysteine-rich repeat protein